MAGILSLWAGLWDGSYFKICNGTVCENVTISYIQSYEDDYPIVYGYFRSNPSSEWEPVLILFNETTNQPERIIDYWTSVDVQDVSAGESEIMAVRSFLDEKWKIRLREHIIIQNGFSRSR